MMKKVFLFGVFSALPLMMMAQDDDMYFVPTKDNVAKEAKTYGMPKNTYYSGSDRTVDEYNKRSWSSVAPIDSAGNDIIDFSAERGVYPDTIYGEQVNDDYRYTRRMSRFDDYYSPSAAYWEGYRDGRWSSPWYYSRWYGWYDPWYYDPWYYSSWYGPSWYYGGWYGGYYVGWYDYYRPWYYGGWYGPGYWGGGVVHTGKGGSGRFHVNRNVSSGSRTYHNGGRATYSNGSFGNSSTMRNGSFGTSRNSNSNSTRSTSTYSNNSSSNGSFSSGSSRSSSSFGGSFGGSSHGGSRSGGSFSRGRR